MTEWKPIDTAPKDETWVILLFKDDAAAPEPVVRSAFWSEEYSNWYDSEAAGRTLVENYGPPIGWIPIPSEEDNSVIIGGRNATATNPISSIDISDSEIYAQSAAVSRGTLCMNRSVIISVDRDHWLAGLLRLFGLYVCRQH